MRLAERAPAAAFANSFATGQWQLGEKLSTDSIACGYRAERDGSPALLRLMHPELAKVPAARSWFVASGYAAHMVPHPGVVRASDTGTLPDGTPYLSFELLEGESLHARRAHGRLECVEGLELFLRVLDIVAIAHVRKVQHGDLTARKIWIESGAVRVLGFGLVPDGEALRSWLLGEPPAQRVEPSGEVTRRSDVQAIAALLSEHLLAVPGADEAVRDRVPVPPAGVGFTTWMSLITLVEKARRRAAVSVFDFQIAIRQALKSRVSGRSSRSQRSTMIAHTPSQSEQQSTAGRYSAVLDSQETVKRPSVERTCKSRGAEPSHGPEESTRRANASATSIGRVQLCKQYEVEQPSVQPLPTAHTSHDAPAPSEALRILLFTGSSLLALDLSYRLSSWGCVVTRKEDPRSDYDVVLVDIDTITLREATRLGAFQASRIIALSDDDAQHVDGAERCMPSYEWDALRQVLLASPERSAE
jgi:hypothetical protein